MVSDSTLESTRQPKKGSTTGLNDIIDAKAAYPNARAQRKYPVYMSELVSVVMETNTIETDKGCLSSASPLLNILLTELIF